MIANVKKILYFLYGVIDYNKVIVPVSSVEKNFACMTKLQYAVLFNITNFWTLNCTHACTNDLLEVLFVKFKVNVF